MVAVERDHLTRLPLNGASSPLPATPTSSACASEYLVLNGLCLIVQFAVGASCRSQIVERQDQSTGTSYWTKRSSTDAMTRLSDAA